MKSLLFKSTLLVLTLSLNSVQSQISIDNGFLYFQDSDQYLLGHGSDVLEYHSNDNLRSRIKLYTKSNVRLGDVLGIQTDAASYFGLTDSDGNWSYVASTDRWTALKVDNSNKMLIYNNGRVDLLGTVDATAEPGTGVLQIGGGLRLDANELITNTNGALFINQDNNGDVVFDSNTMRVDASANRVGMGYSAPETKLEVKGTVRATSEDARSHRTEIGHTGTHGFINTSGAGDLLFRHDGETRMRLKDNGKVVIGSVPSPSDEYRLYVEKGILAEQVRVAVNSSAEWADYVFDETYSKMPAAKVQDFIAKNKHLPNVPSANEVVEKGINLAEMDATLLRQIEELWLHVIELKEENKEMKTELEEIKSRK